MSSEVDHEIMHIEAKNLIEPSLQQKNIISSFHRFGALLWCRKILPMLLLEIHIIILSSESINSRFAYTVEVNLYRWKHFSINLYFIARRMWTHGLATGSNKFIPFDYSFIYKFENVYT